MAVQNPDEQKIQLANITNTPVKKRCKTTITEEQQGLESSDVSDVFIEQKNVRFMYKNVCGGKKEDIFEGIDLESNSEDEDYFTQKDILKNFK